MMELRDTPGVYQITCAATGDTYIGGSRRIHVRVGSHLWHLRKGVHSNKRMQELFDCHGEGSFKFEALLRLRSHRSVAVHEGRYITNLRPSLNRRGAGFGTSINIPVSHELKMRLTELASREPDKPTITEYVRRVIEEHVRKIAASA